MPEVNLSGPSDPSLSSGYVYPRDTRPRPTVYVFMALPVFHLGTESQAHKGIAFNTLVQQANPTAICLCFLYFYILASISSEQMLMLWKKNECCPLSLR